MNKILELREKRAKAWEAAKAFLDSKRGADGLLSAEDTATYDKMEADVVALGKEIERLERQANIDAELSRPTSSRYHLLNLHAAFSTERPAHTIEFRAFNGTLHAGEVKSYIQLCLAISHQALTTKAASPTRPDTDNPKYTFRCWLLRLGFIGEEFETAREHLTKRLPGNAAWRQAS